MYNKSVMFELYDCFANGKWIYGNKQCVLFTVRFDSIQQRINIQLRQLKLFCGIFQICSEQLIWTLHTSAPITESLNERNNVHIWRIIMNCSHMTKKKRMFLVLRLSKGLFAYHYRFMKVHFYRWMKFFHRLQSASRKRKKYFSIKWCSKTIAQYVGRCSSRRIMKILKWNLWPTVFR